MENKNDFLNDKEDFEIIDFDLNEYNEKNAATNIDIIEDDFEECESELPANNNEISKENTTSTGLPNRDMLKTILMILSLIVVACVFLGFIAFLANNVGGDSKSKKKTENRKEESYTKQSKSTKSKKKTEDKSKKDLEDNIDEITNKVKEDATTEKTTAATTEKATTEKTTEATTEEPTTEATTEATNENTTEEETIIETTPEE